MEKETHDCHGVKCESVYKSKSPNFRTTILIIAIFLLCLILLLFILRHYLRCHQRQQPQDELIDEERGPMTVVEHFIWNIRTEGLPQIMINSIAIVNYKRCDDRIQGTECSVCLTEFEEEEVVRLMPECSHAFHIRCIDKWLLTHKNCPSCRTPINSENTTPREEEAESSNRADMRLSSARLQLQESPSELERSV